MGTPIAGKTHRVPVSTDKIPLSPDGYTTVGDLPGGGSGGGGWIYGDGSDGPLTLNDGDTWVPGNYTDVTIVDGATVRIDPSALFWPVMRCTGTFTINGTLDLSAPATTTDRFGAVSSVVPAGGFLGGGGDGGQAAGTAAIFLLTAFNFFAISALGTPVGGGGGSGSIGSGGAAAALNYYPKSKGPQSGSQLFSDGAVNAPIGGGGGGGDSTNYGGGGGAGGYWAVICAKHIVHGADNIYNLQGGAGAPGGDNGSGSTGHGDCGGGGGGAAGYWITISDDLAGPAPTIVGTGGAGGAGCGTGTDGQPGDDGFVVHLLNN